jgi:hypothetical protein
VHKGKVKTTRYDLNGLPEQHHDQLSPDVKRGHKKRAEALFNLSGYSAL